MFPIQSKPYVIRALYEWCADYGLTPHVVIKVDDNCHVPMAHVRDGYITFNISMTATHKLEIDNQWISFYARFGGVEQEVVFPVATVVSFFARETQEGIGFPYEENYTIEVEDEDGESFTPTTEPTRAEQEEAPAGQAKVLDFAARKQQDKK